jgi:hypothetical protein
MHPDLGQPVFAQWYTSTALINAVQNLLGCDDQLQMGWFGRVSCLNIAQRIYLELFNLLINPVSHNFALRWHRDDIGGDATEDEERRALDAWKPYGVSPAV